VEEAKNKEEDEKIPADTMRWIEKVHNKKIA